LVQNRYGILVITVLAVTLLSGCKARFVPMDLQDARLAWREFEQATYDFLINDEKKAENIMTVQKGAGNHYEIDLTMEILGGQHLVGAVVSGETFEPVSSYNRVLPPPAQEANKRESFGVYEGRNLKITVYKDGKEQDFSVKLPQMVMDNESALMLVRNLPLAAGYKKLVNLAIIATVQVAPYEVWVEGVETVQVPYGEVECYKVVFSYKGLGGVPDMYAWYSTDEHKDMVKYVNQNVTFELTGLEVRQPAKER
jgi:hypothetical protein